MSKKSPWDRILRASTTSRAILIASEFPIPELSNSLLPANYDNLSLCAQKNALAVRRALGVRVEGLEETGWETWQETEADKALWPMSDANQGESDSDVDTVDGSDEEDDVRSDLPGERGAQREKGAGEDVVCDSEGRISEQVLEQHENRKGSRSDANHGKVLRETEGKPTPEEVKYAQELKHWAVSAPHTTPSATAIQGVSRSNCVPALLRVIAPPDGVENVLAAVLNVFTENVGSSFASHVVQTLMIPYVTTLNSPAPRDIMQSMVSFSERHWRAVVAMFRFICQRDQRVSGALAELLVRVSAVMPVQGAADGLRAFAQAPWGEDGIRVVEALLSRCKSEENIASIIVPALERNVVGSEKSVRFGKLLFSCAKDLPDLAKTYREAMESICSRSKVFLAKRAIAVLDKQSSAT